MILFSKLLQNKKTIITDEKIDEFSNLKKIAMNRKLNLLTIGKKI